MKIDFDRSSNHHANYYDREFNLLRFGEVTCPPDWNREIRKPHRFEDMITLAEKISKGYRFVRVDFYEVNDEIYFGEITFYPASGTGKFMPDTVDIEIGKLLKL